MTRAYELASFIPVAAPAPQDGVVVTQADPLLTAWQGVVTEAPSDSVLYARQNGAWIADAVQADVPNNGEAYARKYGAWIDIAEVSGLPDAPMDDVLYGRRDGGWVHALSLDGGTMVGALTLAADPVNPLDAATKQYADASAATAQAAAIAAANTYSDSGDASTLTSATTYTDTSIANAIIDAGTY
jgi:hypothetical protein